MYKLTPTTSILRLADGATIPADSVNTEYQEYQKWVAKGNTAAPVDPPTLDEQNAPILSALREIDAKAIRGLLEYVASKPDASQFTKDLAAQAAAERAKLKK